MNIRTALLYIITVTGIDEIQRRLSIVKFTNNIKNEDVESYFYSLMTSLIDSQKFVLKIFLIVTTLLAGNFILLWGLTKTMPKNRYNFVIASVVSIIAFSLLRHAPLSWFIQWYFAPVIGTYLSIVIINYTVSRKLPIIQNTICFFLSLISWRFINLFALSVHSYLHADEVDRYRYGFSFGNRYDIVTFLIICFVATTYYFLQVKYKKLNRKYPGVNQL